jgi:hypothetical protein
MLDDLRDQADNGELLEEEGDFFEFEEQAEPERPPFLGMTAVQRFVIAVMLLLMICMLSSFCLLVSEKIVPPFL